MPVGNTRSTLEPNATVHVRANPGTQARVVAMVLACAIGLMVAARFAAGDDPVAPTGSAVRSDPSDGFSIGEEVPTSFGFVAVEYARAISGPTMDQIAGGHNAAGLVSEGAIEVQVGATMTNFTKGALGYSPEQFELLDGKGNLIPLSEVPEVPGQLQPSAAIDMTLKFVTTTDARPFSVRFVDATTSEVRLIPLGAVGCAVSSGAGEALPTVDGCSQPQTAGEHSAHGAPSGGN